MRVTLSEIADKAGVDVSTVSRALRGSPRVRAQTQEKILKIYRELSQRVNLPRYRNSRQGLLCLCMRGENLPQETLSSDPFTRQLQSMQQVASEYGYGVMVGVYSAQGMTPTDRMMENGEIAGVLLMYSTIDDPVFGRLERLSIPFIQVHRMLDRGHLHYIGVDDRGATREMADYLLDKGYHDLAFIGGSMNRLPPRHKQWGYEDAMRDRGLRIRPQWVVHLPDGNRPADAERATRELLTSPHRPRAILAVTDRIAFDVIATARKLGLVVPRDLAVAGFDDHEKAALCSPPLTTVQVPWVEMVRLATVNLVQLVEHRSKIGQIQIRMNTRLIVRRSA